MIDRREFLKSAALGSLFGPAVCAGGSSARPIVKTTLGRLRGAYANGVYSFKGIHYGASTAGAMRFLPASPPKPWTGVREALELGPPAPQDMAFAESAPELVKFFPDSVGPGAMSEDCLVLNLWTPSLRGPGKRPVMVWLHGGGYAIGSSGVPVYDGTNLAGKQDVVVVGINHRLNIFGYLYLATMGGEKYADSGNLGMLDIVLALRWVQANIAQFGGDPGNVTIFGQSGGGAKVSTLMAMPSAKGLFHKAIVESYSQLRGMSPGQADELARKYLAQLKIAPERLDDLLKVPMEQLTAAWHSMGWGLITLSPVIDGRSLPRHPFDPDAPAITAKVPMLIGSTADEYRSYPGLKEPALFSLNEAGMRNRLKTRLHLTDDSKLDALIGVYRKNRPNATPSDVYFAVATDLVYRMDAIAQAERKAAQGVAPAYMYRFDWPLSARGGTLRAGHAAELPFVFDNLGKATGFVDNGASAQRLADKVSGAWVAFARTGNPNYASLPHWPTYDAATRATMILNDECRVVNDPGKEERLAMFTLAPPT
jgi:para-nitrobenzyl esterase